MRLAIAGYTFNKFKLDQTLEMVKKVDVHYLCIKDFHLPLKSTDEEIAAFHAKCKSFDVTGYGVGPIYMGTEEEVNNAFAYAKRVGVKTVVGVPFKMVDKKRVSSPELLQVVNRKVREYDMKYAIHNHGPDMPELFPTAESAIELIKDLDQRMGLCLDIGHQLRDGKDPVKAMLEFADRVHDIHIKNVTAATRQGRAIEMFCAVAGLEALPADPRYATNPARVSHRDELVAIIAARLATRPASQWLEALEAAQVPCGPINDLAQVFEDRQVIHRGMVATLAHPEAGEVRVVANPVRFSATPARSVLAPPLLGQHTDEILREVLGLGGEAIEDLRSRKVI